MEEILEAVKPWYEGNKAPPSVIQFQMIDGCNQKCRFCDFPSNGSPPENDLLKDKDYYQIIQEAIELGVKEIRICGGGEPFFRKDRILKIISMIKNTPIRCRIITNGSMLHKDDIEKIVDAGVEDIQFSVHGPDEESHDYMVDLKGAFKLATSNIKHLNDYKIRSGKKTPFVSIYFILARPNYKKLMKLGRLTKELGVQRLGIYDVDLRSEDSIKLKLDGAERERIKVDMLNLKRYMVFNKIDLYIQETIFHVQHAKRNKMYDLLQLEDDANDLLNVPCYEPWYYFGIAGDGKVEICPQIGVPDLNMKGKSLKEVWFGDYMDRVRKKLMDKKIAGDCLFCCNTEITIPLRSLLKHNQPKGVE